MVTPPRSRRLLARREVVRTGLAAAAGIAAAAALAACADPEAATVSSTASPDADVTLLTKAVASEGQLLGLAVATLHEHRDQRDVVQPLVNRQRTHVRRLRTSLTGAPDLRRGRPPAVPGGSAAAITALRDAVSAAEQARLEDCLAATSGLLARLFASVSASHATTVETLRVRR